jgi:serine/threonine protein kinase
MHERSEDRRTARSGQPPTSDELPIGKVFGGFKILAAIQRGGMGEVFLAERTADNDKVVLKRLLADYLEDDRYVRMFRSEAKVMSSLDHPNIVKVIDVPVIDGKQCLALEYVQGRNLAQILRRCRELNTVVPAQIALYVLIEVLRGLDYAHRFVLGDGRPLGLVHRDVTPGNILVAFDGQVKITDFGIAKSEMSSVSTTVGVVKGTTRYLSPEQIRGLPATQRSDLFSAAVVLVEALSGRALFDHGTVPPTLFAIVTGQRPKMTEVLPFEAPKLAQTLERALDLKPERRYRDARELLEALEDAQRALGRPIDRAGASVFLKELFRGTEQPFDGPDAENPWRLDAMDLTYLFEIQEAGFKPSGTPFDDKSDELERVKALLKAAVPGSKPLDASQFEEKTAPPDGSLAEGLSSPSALRSPSVRPPTKLDRPPPSDLDATDDVFNDRTQAVDDGMVVRESPKDLADDLRDVEPHRSLGSAYAEPPIERVATGGNEVIDVEAVLALEARLPEEPTSVERAPAPLRPIPAISPPQRKLRPRRWPIAVAFASGLAIGASPWLVARPARFDAWISSAEEAPVAVGQPALHHWLSVAHEGERRGAVEPPVMAVVDVRLPRGARVAIDGAWIEGRVPIVGLELAPGPHKILIAKKRYRKRIAIDLEPGTRVDLTRR